MVGGKCVLKVTSFMEDMAEEPLLVKWEKMLIPALMPQHANQRSDKAACLYSFH